MSARYVKKCARRSIAFFDKVKVNDDRRPPKVRENRLPTEPMKSAPATRAVEDFSKTRLLWRILRCSPRRARYASTQDDGGLVCDDSQNEKAPNRGGTHRAGGPVRNGRYLRHIRLRAPGSIVQRAYFTTLKDAAVRGSTNGVWEFTTVLLAVTDVTDSLRSV